MNKTQYYILPILGIIAVLLLGWSTISAQTIEKLENQYREIEALPSGSVFDLIITDDDMSGAASEYLIRFKNEIQEMVQQTTGMELELADPVVEFKTDKTAVSLKVGKGFLKVSVSIQAEITWDGDIHVNVTSVDVPIVSIDPATVNSYIEGPVRQGMRKLEEKYEILDLNVGDGMITIRAMKK